MITLIVARAANGAIGRDGSIPWHIPEDLHAFQRETHGGALVMGRRTWESLPVKPLRNRLNIVVSATAEVPEFVAPSVTAAIALASAQGYDRVYGIGGARIYQAMLPLAHRLLISEVALEVEDADTFFPEFDGENWQMINQRKLRLAGPKCYLSEYLGRSGASEA